MKKMALVLGGLFVITVVALIVVYNMLGGIVRNGVETVGPRATGTPVTLGGVDISIFSGKAGLNNFVVGNPQGFSDNKAFTLGNVRTRIDVGSVTGDVIVVKSILVDGATITWEGWEGDNQRKILENIKKFAGSSEKSGTTENKTAGKTRKVIIDDFRFQNGAINFVIGGTDVGTVKLPDIHMTDIGKNAGGQDIRTTIAQLYAQVFSGVSSAIAANRQLLTKNLSEITGKGKEVLKAGRKALGGAAGGAAGGATEEVKKLGGSMEGLFKK